MRATIWIGSLLLTFGGVAEVASAQDALGAGDALDRSLRWGGSGRNEVVGGEAADFRVRNLLITNNVVAGRGFRESVGYTAPDDFRGEAGSDDLFQFRADAALTAPELFRSSATFERLRYGQQLGYLQYSTSSEGASIRDVNRPTERTRAQLLDSRLRLDRLSEAAGLTQDFQQDAEPSNIGLTISADGESAIAIRTSPLQGLSELDSSRLPELLGLSSFDIARMSEDLAEGRSIPAVGVRFDRRFEQFGDLESLFQSDTESSGEPGTSDGVDGSVAAPIDRLNSRVEVASRDLSSNAVPQIRMSYGAGDVPEYRRILERIAERYLGSSSADGRATEIESLRDLDAQRQALSEQLRSTSDRPVIPTIPGGTGDGTGAGQDPEDMDDEDAPADPLDSDFIDVLRHGEQIDSLATSEEGRFAELMTGGEEALAAGEYFQAERRFDRALRFIPGHPLATAGQAHAQIGAGLYLSAALTLQGLFTHQPEMIDARYSDRLVPNRPRLLTAVGVLETRIEKQERDRAENGMLLAYIGRLLKDDALVSTGLDVMRESGGNDPLQPVLRRIWISSSDGADR